MTWVSFLAQAGSFAREAVTSNFWGLGCPYHCSGNSLLGLAVSYLLGLLTGILLTLCLWIFISLPPSSLSPSLPSVPESVVVFAESTRRRLQGYQPALNEQPRH